MNQRANISVWLVFFTFFTAFGVCEIAAGKIIYVDEIAAGANDGSSWDDAYNFLQDALADANEADKPVEIRLAQGAYSPDKDALNPEGTADRQATFQLINGVELKGGYAGLGTPNPDTRNIVLFETALVGDIRQTGFGGGNSFHVVTGSGTDETAVLDGLIIAGGNADGPRLGEKPNYDYQLRYGGGLYNDAGSPTLVDCVFSDNSAYIAGGGIYNSNGSSPVLTNCVFYWNSAVEGCGIFNFNSNPALTGCVFNMNIANNNGGGMYNEQSNPILTDCTFTDNSGSYGGGMYNNMSNPTLTNCEFIANTTLTIRSTDSMLGGGGGMYNQASSPILNYCIFADNSAYASSSNLGGGMYNNDNSNPVLTGCLFSLNWAENYGGGMYNSESSPILIDCVFNGNWAEEYGGGMYNRQSSPILLNCGFVWNWAAVITSYHDSYPSGAGMYNEAGSPILSACLISGNYAEGDGAGMYNSDSSPELDNCIIAGNWTADFGGGMYIESGSPTLTNCTFSRNIAYEGNALFCDSPQQKTPGNVELTNCILRDGDDEISNYDDSVITINYSNIQGGFPGRGNIDADPLFAREGYWVDFYDPNIIVGPDDPNASWTDGDYHLKSGAGRWDWNSESWVIDEITSPCIDAGEPNSPVAFEPAPNGGIINMGAFGGTIEASKSPSDLSAKYGGGTGEPNDPYLIYTAEHLNTIGTEPNDWDKHFWLMADIDLTGYAYDRALIAPDTGGDGFTFPGPSFTGLFDGGGYAVSNLTITGRSYLGLFGQVGPGGQVMGLGVEEVNITGSYTTIGGLVGDNLGNIAACYSTGTITGYNRIGGLVGYNNYGNISASYSTCTAGAISSGNQSVGGLVGVDAGSITTSYSSGDVSGQRSIGGLVGWSYQSNIINCYSTGSVSGDTNIGGLVGKRDTGAGKVTGCFWDVETSGQSSSSGGTGKTTAEMQTAGTFLEAGWDFVDENVNGEEDIWWILEGLDYPKLAWESTE